MISIQTVLPFPISFSNPKAWGESAQAFFFNHQLEKSYWSLPLNETEVHVQTWELFLSNIRLWL